MYERFVADGAILLVLKKGVRRIQGFYTNSRDGDAGNREAGAATTTWSIHVPSIEERLRQITLKLKRAKEHAADLDREVRRFFETSPYKVGTRRDPQTRKLIYYITSVEPSPDCLPLIAGDTIQNLMSTLDHLAYQIVCNDTGDSPPNPKWIYFPIADDVAKYEATKRGKIQGARQETIDAFDVLKPYKGGNDQLWILYRLNNIEKHRLLITVGSMFQSLDLGAHISTMMKKAFPNLPDFPSMSAFFKPADVLFPLKAGDELFIDGPDAEVNEKMQFRFNVALNEPGIVEGKPLLETLHQFTALVEGIVGALTPRLKAAL